MEELPSAKHFVDALETLHKLVSEPPAEAGVPTEYVLDVHDAVVTALTAADAYIARLAQPDLLGRGIEADLIRIRKLSRAAANSEFGLHERNPRYRRASKPTERIAVQYKPRFDPETHWKEQAPFVGELWEYFNHKGKWIPVVCTHDWVGERFARYITLTRREKGTFTRTDVLRYRFRRWYRPMGMPGVRPYPTREHPEEKPMFGIDAIDHCRHTGERIYRYVDRGTFKMCTLEEAEEALEHAYKTYGVNHPLGRPDRAVWTAGAKWEKRALL